MTNVEQICATHLQGLEEDILEYIVGSLEEFVASGDGDVEETTTMVAQFLESAGYIEEEEAALQKAKEVLDQLLVISQPSSSSSTTNKTAAPISNEPQKLSEDVKKLTLSLQDASVVPEEARGRRVGATSTNSLITKPGDETSTSTFKSKKKKKATTKTTSTSAYDQAQAQALEVEQELWQARVNAIHARSKLGAYKGALDAPSFTLPNPGGGQPLLEDAACRLNWGKRYGLIGRNGMGKSTLLRALAARAVGEIPPNVTVHYVSQEVHLTDSQRNKTPVECVVDADLERTLLLEELQELTQKADAGELDVKGSQRQSTVLNRLEEIGADAADRRAKTLLDNLGFSEALQARPLSQLSGGWRVRTMLAAAIFAQPDLLLLDEPTNHLSILAVMWLARELATSDTWKQRIVVIVSHDRHFLDEVCTDCLHISGASRRLTQSKGNYSLWAKRRKDEQTLFEKEQAKRQAEIDTLREYAGHGFKYGGSGSQINKMQMKAKQGMSIILPCSSCHDCSIMYSVLKSSASLYLIQSR